MSPVWGQESALLLFPRRKFHGQLSIAALLLRNLDQTTSEAKVTEALASVLKAVIPKSVKILKDPRTQMSVGYGFAQFKSLSDATEMYNALMRVNPPLTLDSKQGTDDTYSIF